MKTVLFVSLSIILGLLILVYGFLYFVQEQIIFFPQKLDKNYRFAFDQAFEEKTILLKDGLHLHGLLFNAKNPKGLVFYLHGNAGSLSSWGGIAQTYTDLNYDVFILDYRGYGKSEGTIHSETQLHEDIQTAYDVLKQQYTEDKIVVLGYSIGSGLASKLASTNHPKLLILQAPYYSLTDVMHRIFPYIPSVLLKYKLENNKHIKACKMPVVLFHGDQDEVIYYGSSLKLKDECKNIDRLITLKGLGHNGMTESMDYQNELKKILNNQ